LMLKPVINAKEAVKYIRSGMSDEELMKEYVISARGLESLFNKLVEAGEIERSELDRRQLRFQRSHVVSLFDLPEPEQRVAVIDPDDALVAIRAGLSDELLMSEYNLSARGLASLFRKLVEEEHITQTELDLFRPSSHAPEIAITPIIQDDSFPETITEPTPIDTMHPTPTPSRYRVSRVQLAAVFGFLIGVVTTLTLIFLTNMGPDLGAGLWFAGGTNKANPIDHAVQDVNNFIAILKAIEREAEARGETDSFDTAASYRKCLEACGGLTEAYDEGDRALLANCRHECMARYDQHFRQIRKRFYESPKVD
jgi:hypothetical protein